MILTVQMLRMVMIEEIIWLYRNEIATFLFSIAYPQVRFPRTCGKRRWRAFNGLRLKIRHYEAFV